MCNYFVYLYCQMTSEGSYVLPPSFEGGNRKLPSSEGIIGQLFGSKVDENYFDANRLHITLVSS